VPQSNAASRRVDALVERLERAQATDPNAATMLAIELIARERVHRLLEPALDLLVDRPVAAARPALRERFLDLTENGIRYDQDCSLRVRLVKALRAIGSPDDVDLAECGVRTIQLQPPARIDVAQALRGQSLLWQSEHALERAQYLAVELLQDPHQSTFSGEPTVTAIQLLAASGQILPIWSLARRPGTQPDVLAQAFASLRNAPADLQLDALRTHLADSVVRGESGEGVALVAAEAIVLNHLADGYDAVADLLGDTPNLNLLTYLVRTITRTGDEAMRDRLKALAAIERDPRRAAIFADALGLRSSRPRR
jgi:hypothetical protein